MILPELIRYVREKIPRLSLYDTFIVLCLIDDELIGRRGFSLTGIEWYLKDNQLHWGDTYRENIKMTREGREVLDQMIDSVKKMDDQKLRDLLRQTF